jgi:putative spermidine/putrescine transport system substrate-binding protein
MFARMLFAAVLTLAATATDVMARDLTVVTRGEPMAAATRSLFVQPFIAATTISITQVDWDGSGDTLENRLKSPDNTWDLIQVQSDELATGCAAGWFEKLDFSAIGGKDHYLPQGVSDCGVGATMANLVLAWDRDKFPATPNWSDFWDVAKYPGKRGLRRGPQGNLEIALMADGVAPGDVYKVLATSDGVDRAFRKLDQLKPYLVWWSTGPEAARILGSGDVLMTSGPSDAIVTAARVDHHNFGMQWTGSLYDVTSWALAKGTPNQRQATQFLYFIGTPAIQARLLGATGSCGLAKGVNDGLTPDQLALSPTNPANLSVAVRLDSGFWHDNLAKLGPRFDAWLAQH